MKIRIREGNDFDVAWAIKRAGQPEDLSTAINMKLTLVVYGLVIEHNLFTVTDNVLSINIPKEVATVNGDYRLIFEYILPDAGQPDGDLKCKTDVVPFRIVPFTAKADDIYTINVTSDIAIGLKGDKGDDGADAYQIWLDLGNEGTYEDFIAYLRQPAVDAGASISELEGEIQVSEGLRVQAESEREQAESERQVTIQEAVTATQEATTAASLADTARLSIQDDLALKANHGYTSNPKTLKQVDDSLVQLESNSPVINVTVEYPLSEGYYTLATAREAIPLARRKFGLEIGFQGASGFEQYKFMGTNIAGLWFSDTYWDKLFISSPVINVTVEYPLSEGYYTLGTAIAAIPSSRRKIGLEILFYDGVVWRQWRFNAVSMSQWGADLSWIELKNYTEEFIRTTRSAFFENVFLLDLARTKSITRAIKKIEVPFYPGNREFHLKLLNKPAGSQSVTLYIAERLSDGTDRTMHYADFTIVEGLHEYVLNIPYPIAGQIKLTADFDNVTSWLNSHPSNYKTALLNLTTYYPRAIDMPEVIQRSFGVFVPNCNITRGFTDVTKDIIKSIISIKISGPWYGRKFLLRRLAIIDGERMQIQIDEEYPDGTTLQAMSTSATPYDISQPYQTIIVDDSINELATKRGLTYEIKIWNEALPVGATGIIVEYNSSQNKYSNRGFERIDDGNPVGITTFNTIRDMKGASYITPIQIAGGLPFRLTDKELPHPDNAFTPMWNALKGVNNVTVEHKIIIPPSVPGHNNNHAVLTDIAPDDTFLFMGVSDKIGRVYESIDYGETLTELSNILDYISEDERRDEIFAVKYLNDGRLLANIVLRTSGNVMDSDNVSYLYISSADKTSWSRVTKSDGSPFNLTYYKETDVEGNKTFEVFGRIMNGWGFDKYKNFVTIAEYGYSSISGTPQNPTYSGVGHMITGKIYVSKDYGETFEEIFDYINPPSNIVFINPVGMHHSHGVFIDRYNVIDGIPRIVGMMGDAENRLVYSDDLGKTWYDNRSNSNYTQQSVSGMATPFGYLTTPDNVTRNGIQLVHRATKWDNMWSDLIFDFMRDEDYQNAALQSRIVYVGGNLSQRTLTSPLLTCFTPETSGAFNAGARGGCAISYDGGRTWEQIWRDDVGALRLIQYSNIWETSNGDIYLAPSALWVLDYDGRGLYGRIIRFRIT